MGPGETKSLASFARGVAFNPQLGYLFVNTSNLATLGKMVPDPEGEGYRNELAVLDGPPGEIEPKQANKGGEEVRALANLPAEYMGPVIGTFHLGRRKALGHQERCPEAHLQRQLLLGTLGRLGQPGQTLLGNRLPAGVELAYDGLVLDVSVDVE